MQFNLKHLLLAVTGIAIACAALALLRGEPDHIRLARMSSTFEAVQDLLTKEIDVAYLDGYIDDEYAWRANVPEERLPEILNLLSASPTGAQPPNEFLTVCGRSWWCDQWPPNSLDIYKSPEFDHASRGADGVHFMDAYAKSTNHLYVWHKDQPF